MSTAMPHWACSTTFALDSMTAVTHRSPQFMNSVGLGEARTAFVPEQPDAYKRGTGIRIPYMQPGYTGHVPGRQDHQLSETYGSYHAKTFPNTHTKTILPPLDITSRPTPQWTRHSPVTRTERHVNGSTIPYQAGDQTNVSLRRTIGNDKNVPLLQQSGGRHGVYKGNAFPGKSPQLVSYQRQLAWMSTMS